MSTIKSSTTTTTAYQVVADTTGALVIQTGATPTTAITVGADQSVTFAGTPTYSAGTANGVAYLNGSKVLTTGSALTFDGANFGVGVTPSAWATYKAIDVLGYASFSSYNGNEADMSTNAYYNAGWKYKNTAAATLYQQDTGVHRWQYAPSGTAGNAISWTQAMTLDASGRLGIGTTTPTEKLYVQGLIYSNNGSADNFLTLNGDGAIKAGVQFRANGAGPYTQIYFDNATNNTHYKNIASGAHVFATNGNEVLRIKSSASSTYPMQMQNDSNQASMGTTNACWMYLSDGQIRIIPRYANGAVSDNIIDIGDSGSRMRVIYAGTGTINTSDANEKQDIQDFTDAEKQVAVKIKALFKTYRFKDAVAEKGDDARIHVGVIAQEVRDAFTSEGLDAHRYALFCSNTWYTVNNKDLKENGERFTAEDEGAVERTRLGIRYSELLSFVISAL